MEPLGALCALGSGVALLAHALARLVALLPMTAVRVAAWPEERVFPLLFNVRNGIKEDR